MRRLLAAPGFARLWVSAFFGETAEWMLQVALPVYLFVRTGSAVTTALSIVLGLLPAVLLSPVAGIVADRWDRRVVLAAVCAGQALVVLPLLVSSALPVPAVYAVMAAQAGLASVFEPARSALVPDLVGVEDVTPANGLMSVNSSVARLAGGWAGGALLGWGGLDRVIVGYLVALAAAGLLLAFPFRRAAVRKTAAEQTDWLAGVRDLAGKRLRATSASALLTSLAQGMFLVLFVVFVLDILRGSEADAGLLRGVQAIGGLAAGVAVATLARRVAPVLLQGWGLVAAGLLSMAIWNLPGATTVLGVYVGLFMAVGAPAIVAGAGLLSHVQAETGPDRAGRVLSTVYALMAAGTAAGSLLAGALVAVTGPTVLLNVQASLHVSAGLVVLGWGKGRSRRSRTRKVVTVDECRLSSPPATST